jgi:hypothetical protein
VMQKMKPKGFYKQSLDVLNFNKFSTSATNFIIISANAL